MRFTVSFAGLLIVIGAGLAQDVLPVKAVVPEVSAELKSLNGYWKPESVIADGAEQMTSLEAKASIILRIRDGEYALFAIKDPKTDSGLRLCSAQLTVDSSSRTFTLIVTDGYRKGQKLHGIYDHAGERLRVCYGPAEQPRPSKFDAAKGSAYFCETWVIEKK